MKTSIALALAALAGLATISAASAETVVIHRDGYHHRPFFHPHFHPRPHFHHDHRTVIIRR